MASGIPHNRILALVGALILVVAVWWQTALHLVSIGLSHEYYSHILVVPILSLWLIYRDRSIISSVCLKTDSLGLFAFACSALLAILAYVIDIRLLDHFAFIAALISMVLLVLGRQFIWTFRFAILFLFLSVPFGDSFAAYLQEVAAQGVIMLLAISGIDHNADGVLIEISSGAFEIAEACSGVKFVMASMVCSVLLAHIAFEKTKLKVGILLAGFLIPIIANVMRVFGILLLSEMFDTNFAKAVDHIVYGYGVFVFVLLILIWGAFKFSDIDEEPPVHIKKYEWHKPSPMLMSFGLIISFSILFISEIPKAPLTAVFLDENQHCVLQQIPRMQCDDCSFRFLGSADLPTIPLAQGPGKAYSAVYRSGGTKVYVTIKKHKRFFDLVSALNSPWAGYPYNDQWRVQAGKLDAQFGNMRTRVFKMQSEKTLVLNTANLGGNYYSSEYALRFTNSIDQLMNNNPTMYSIVLYSELDGDMQLPLAVLKEFAEKELDAFITHALDGWGKDSLCAA